jgi:hypothetical protein
MQKNVKLILLRKLMEWGRLRTFMIRQQKIKKMLKI